MFRVITELEIAITRNILLITANFINDMVMTLRHEVETAA